MLFRSGNGTYAAANFGVAETYAGYRSGAKDAILEIIIPDTSKYITYDELIKLRNEARYDIQLAMKKLKTPALHFEHIHFRWFALVTPCAIALMRAAPMVVSNPLEKLYWLSGNRNFV